MALIQQMMEEEEKRLNEALQENAESGKRISVCITLVIS